MEDKHLAPLKNQFQINFENEHYNLLINLNLDNQVQSSQQKILKMQNLLHLLKLQHNQISIRLDKNKRKWWLKFLKWEDHIT